MKTFQRLVVRYWPLFFLSLVVAVLTSFSVVLFQLHKTLEPIDWRIASSALIVLVVCVWGIHKISDLYNLEIGRQKAWREVVLTVENIVVFLDGVDRDRATMDALRQLVQRFGIGPYRNSEVFSFVLSGTSQESNPLELVLDDLDYDKETPPVKGVRYPWSLPSWITHGVLKAFPMPDEWDPKERQTP